MNRIGKPSADILLGIAGAIVTAGLTVWFLVTNQNYLYPVMTGLAFLAFIAYLLLTKFHAASPEILPGYQGKRPFNIALTILFVLLVAYALIAVIGREEVYTRPLGFFIAMSLAGGVVVAEILTLPPAGEYASLTLAKIIVLAVALVWSAQVVFPTLLGIDPFAHAGITRSTIEAGRLPAGEAYADFPLFHLATGAMMLLGGIDYKTAVMLSVFLGYAVIALSFTYLLGRLFYNARVGLLAALLLGSAALFVHSGWWMTPNSYAAAFFPPVVYLLIRGRDSDPLRVTGLALFLMLALVFTHTIGALGLAVTLLACWAGYRLYGLFRIGQPMPVTLTVVACLGLAIFGWWVMGSSQASETLGYFFSEGLSQELFARPIAESVSYGLTIPAPEYIFSNLSYGLLWAISFIGCLAAVSRGWGNRHAMALGLAGLVLLALGFFGQVLDLDIIPERWQFMSVMPLAVLVALGLYLIISRVKPLAGRVSLGFILVTALVFLSIVSPLANIDNPGLFPNSTVRYAFEQSELQAAEKLSGLYDGKAALDINYRHVYPGEYETSAVLNSLVSGDFSAQKDELVVIRSQIVEGPFFLSGRIRLGYDPGAALASQGFSRVYDSGSVDAYVDASR